MKPRITVITIGVEDVGRSLRFYRDGLGLPTDGIVGSDLEQTAVAFFDLHAGVKLAVWRRTSIAHDAGIPLGLASPTEFTLGHNVPTKAEVDAVMEEAERAGAVIVKPAQDTFWGGLRRLFPGSRPPSLGGRVESAIASPGLMPNNGITPTRFARGLSRGRSVAGWGGPS